MLGRLWRRWRERRKNNKPAPLPPGDTIPWPITGLAPYDVLATMRGLTPREQLTEQGLPQPNTSAVFNFLARQKEINIALDLPLQPGQRQPSRLRLRWPNGSEGKFLLAHDGEFSYLPRTLGDHRCYTNLSAIEGEIRNGVVYAVFTRLAVLLPDEMSERAMPEHLELFRHLRARCINKPD